MLHRLCAEELTWTNKDTVIGPSCRACYFGRHGRNFHSWHLGSAFPSDHLVLIWHRHTRRVM